jgi:hypothetical protein
MSAPASECSGQLKLLAVINNGHPRLRTVTVETWFDLAERLDMHPALSALDRRLTIKHFLRLLLSKRANSIVTVRLKQRDTIPACDQQLFARNTLGKTTRTAHPNLLPIAIFDRRKTQFGLGWFRRLNGGRGRGGRRLSGFWRDNRHPCWRHWCTRPAAKLEGSPSQNCHRQGKKS